MKKQSAAPGILIVEDEPFIARDISDFLEECGYTVSDICYDTESALQSIERHCPDLCILDINLGSGGDGITLAREIQANKKIPFIFLTSYTDTFTLERAKETMPYGYISKPVQFESLKSTIEIALHNFTNRKGPAVFQPEKIDQAIPGKLSPREIEILKAIYEGKTNRQLANQFYISLSTVKSHVQHIYEKFDCHTRPELIAAIRTILST